MFGKQRSHRFEDVRHGAAGPGVHEIKEADKKSLPLKPAKSTNLSTVLRRTTPAPAGTASSSSSPSDIAQQVGAEWLREREHLQSVIESLRGEVEQSATAMNLMQTASERTNEANQLQLEQTTSQLQEAQAELTQLDEEACQALSAARASLEEQHNEASRREAECQTALQQAQWAATQCESEAAALADALYADREAREMAEQAADQAHDQLFAATSSWQAEHARATMLATELDQCEMRLDEAERLVQHGRAHADHLQGSLIKARSQQRQQQREFEDALDEAHELAAEHVDNVWHQFQQNKEYEVELMGQADQIATLQEQLDAANEGIAHRDALMVDAETTVRCLIDELTEARAETQEAFEQLHAERQLAMEAAEVAAHELRVTQSEAQDALQRMADMMDLQQQQHEAAVKELNAAHFRQSAQWQQRYNASEQSLTSVRGDLDQAMCSLCLKQGEVQRLQATVDDLEAEKLRSNAATERTRVTAEACNSALAEENRAVAAENAMLHTERMVTADYCAKLAEQLNSKTKLLQQADEKYQELMGDLRDASDHIAELRQQLQQTVEALDAQRQRTNEVEQWLVQTASAQASDSDLAQQRGDELSAAMSDRDKFAAALLALHSQHSEMLIDRAHLLDTLSVVRDRVSVMTDECNRQQCELAESTSTEVKLRASISELTDAKLGVEQQLQEAEQRAQREAAAAQQSFAELRERFDQLTADSEVARSQFGSQIGELQREISGLQLELFEAQQGAAEEEERHELQMEQIKREAIEEAAMMGAAETDNLRCRLAEFEEENGKLLDSEQELQNQVATLRRQLSDSQAYLDDFTKDRELIDEQQKAAADVAGHHNLKQRIQLTQTLKDQNAQLRETNARLLSDLKQARFAAASSSTPSALATPKHRLSVFAPSSTKSQNTLTLSAVKPQSARGRRMFDDQENQPIC